MATNELAVQTADMNIGSTSWLDSATLVSHTQSQSRRHSQAQVSKVESLKNICIGNCRLLYGSERFKFYGNIPLCTTCKSLHTKLTQD